MEQKLIFKTNMAIPLFIMQLVMMIHLYPEFYLKMVLIRAGSIPKLFDFDFMIGAIFDFDFGRFWQIFKSSQLRNWFFLAF